MTGQFHLRLPQYRDVGKAALGDVSDLAMHTWRCTLGRGGYAPPRRASSNAGFSPDQVAELPGLQGVRPGAFALHESLDSIVRFPRMSAPV
jgi:hypothetical protein